MRRSNLAVQVALLMVSMVAFTGFAQAQYRASIQGVVTDPQGAVVAGATVTLTNKETNRSQAATSNSAGVYNFNALPPSQYSISVEKSGFKKKVLDNVTVISEQANAVNIELAIGQSSETVNVSGDAAPLIDTETATISGTVTAQQIQTMPSFGRDVFQLLQLAPGAFGDGAQNSGGGSSNLPGNAGPGGPGNTTGIFAIENGAQISVGGGRREVNNFQIDGVGITSVSWAGTAVITPNEDSVKEVKVVTNGYDAEDGRYSGAQVKVISQNGTNQYHGSFFFKGDRPGLNAFQKYNGYGNAPQRNLARFNDWGGSVGGPIIHNRLFGFFSYETIRNKGQDQSQAWFETDQYRAAAPASSAAAKFLGYTGAGPVKGQLLQGPSDHHNCSDIGLVEGENCQTIAGVGLDVGSPLALPLGTPDPSFVSNLDPGIGGGLDGVADLQFINAVRGNSVKEEQYNGRVDFNATSKDLIAGSIYWVPNTSVGLNGSFRPMNAFNNKFVNRAATALWNRTFSPTLLNELRVNAAGWRWYSLKDNAGAPFGLPTTEVQDIAGGGIGNIGPSGFGVGSPSEFNQWTYAGKDVLTKVYHSHTMKMGGEVTRLLFVDAAPWNARPDYHFNNMWDMLNDAPVQESATFNPITGVPSDFRKDTRSTLLGFFFQDDYKVRPNLTLNLGMRWEYFGPLHEKNGNLGVVVLGQGAEAVTGVRVRKGGDLYQASKKDFGPQLGFAWSPTKYNQKIVFRGGFGIGYSGFQEANSLDGRNNPPFLSPAFNLYACPDQPLCTQPNQIVYGPDTFPSSPTSFYGYAANPFGQATFDPTTNLPVPGGQNFSPIGLTGFPSSWPTTRTYRYSFESQYDLGHEWVATLGYQGTATRHLTQKYNLFIYEYGKNNLGLNAFNPLVNNFGFYDNNGRGNFNALLANLRHRFGHSFQLETQYRWSKSMDTGSNNYYGGNYQYTQDREYGPSDYDATHTFKAFGIWSPTIFRGSNGYLEKILGGWTVSGIFNAHSGFPWNPVYNNVPCSDAPSNVALCNPNDGVYAGSGGGPLRPAAYNGGLSTDYSNDAFIKQKFGDGGASALFTAPSFVPGPSLANIIAGTSLPGPVPGAPGVGRNAFRGPRYYDVDATLSKSFGLPRMRVLGEGAKLELRANFFNLFNKLNLSNIQNNIYDPHFGQAQNGLGSRTIEMQARFNF
jgi:hypothetical protein